jgi:protein-S-isoprenylcysteine O-methyltransferase Ste14/membrane-associated phospholipid phosphatase
MAMTMPERTGKILYGLLFIIILPAILVLWARYASYNVYLPPLRWISAGIGAVVLGLALMIAGIYAIMRFGGGLPMNPYPPARLVTGGIFRVVSHPIYIGFCLICSGTAILFDSSAGFWLVSPIVMLSCVALVTGYEKQSLRARFGEFTHRPFLHLASDDDAPPDCADRVSVYLLVMFPWLLLYESVQLLGIPPDAINSNFPFEQKWPVIEWTEIFYASVYIFSLAAPLFARSKRDLRAFSIHGIAATSLVILLYLVIPFISPTRPFVPQTSLGHLLNWERLYDSPAAAFPSFHVIWAFIAAALFSKTFPSLRIFWWLYAILIAASCVTTGMHSLSDVSAGFVAFLIIVNLKNIWQWLRRQAEKIANSWKEWRFGPVRVINHGFYAGVGTMAGLLLIGILTGPHYILPLSITAVIALVSAGLWAQFIEGSPALLRPFGYYGSVVGVIIGAMVSYALGTDIWLTLAAFSIAGPWIQAAGRLRCLVQGCCHGHKAPESVGIRITHPRSRVCRLADLTGVPIHPTPLYSILWNLVIGAFLLRLWFLHSPLVIIAGLYLILTGVGRFVEESYRGEPQTPVVAGLRLYQWIAFASVLIGIAITTVVDGYAPNAPAFDWHVLIMPIIIGLITTCALGVDFPNSNRRFSRLV